MSYQRVIPRDLFNEAKLLKCLGKVCVAIHDGMCGSLTFAQTTDEYKGFHIYQNEEDGSLFCDNLVFYYQKQGYGRIDSYEERIYFFSPYNNKSDWPLLFSVGDRGEEFSVFVNEEDDASFTKEFKETVGIE